MDIKALLSAVDVLGEVASGFSNLPEEQKEAAIASLHCAMVATYLIELAKHLQSGMEPYDAYLATARGDLELTPSQQTMFKLLMPPNA